MAALVKTWTGLDQKSDRSEQERQSSPMCITFVWKWALIHTGAESGTFTN